MDCLAVERPGVAQPSVPRRLMRLLSGLLAAVRRRNRLIDPHELPDHLKRDMGFLDGRDPRPEERYWR